MTPIYPGFDAIGGTAGMGNEHDVSYSQQHIQVLRTDEFDRWLRKLKDKPGRLRILHRIERLSRGNPGDSRSVGNGVSELRLHVGPGYRVYYLHERDGLILLLCGGDKSTQRRDIRTAHALADAWRNDQEADHEHP